MPLSRFGNPFALWSTFGKLLNATSESSRRIEEEPESLLKAFVAGDAFTFERKYKDPIQALPTAKVMVATNDLPQFNDKTEGVWRRVLPAPFDRTIPEARQIKNLAREIVATELPGVFNWAMAGLASLNRRGCFTTPACGRVRLEEHRRDVDPARTFLLENFAAADDCDGLPAAEVYRTYVAWCEANGCRPANSANFGRQLRRTFPTIERIHRRQGRRQLWYYVGLAVQEGSEAATAPDNGRATSATRKSLFLS